MKVRVDDVPLLSPPVLYAVEKGVDWHWAIVYELVPGQPQDLDVAQRHLNFFYAIGFGMEAYKPDDWRGGRRLT
jgi:hypothetical protein